MAADNLWWDVWGLWLAVWVLTVVAFLVAIVVFVKHWRRARSDGDQGMIRGIGFYLHTKSVMGLYQLHRYNEALEQEVEKRKSRGWRFWGSGGFGPLKGESERTDTDEEFRRYIRKAEPITVIGIVTKVLEKHHDIIYVDLTKQELAHNRALVKELGWADGPESTRQVKTRLRGVEAFISVKGLFRKRSQSDTETVFVAPYGNPDDPERSRRIRFTCVTSDLRDSAPTGAFRARCLGKVEDWDPETGELVVHPIAIFK